MLGQHRKNLVVVAARVSELDRSLDPWR